MAKVKAPLFSLAASGSLAHSLTFQHSGETNVVCAWRRKPVRHSTPQLRNRRIMSTLRYNWNKMPESVRQYWNNAAGSQQHISGYNLYIKYHFNHYIEVLNIV